jgi:nicotinate-nucleotide pyrophosphorylase (carboxylating)
MHPQFKKLLEKSIEIWLAEDIGTGDHTSLSTIPEDAIGTSKLLIKEEGVIAGIKIASKVYKQFDREMEMEVFIKDGTIIHPGDIAFTITGKVRSILQTERLILNLLQRLSGVATQTKKYVDLIEDYPTKILDTRKTTPGLRFLEKEAVRIGGGKNHRAGLYDMILIKDNHIDFSGGIEHAIRKAKAYLVEQSRDLKIEVEARNLDDVAKILREGGVQRILLDNFSPELCRKAVKMIDGKAKTEASGGITMETMKDYAASGVNYISVGALTHQIKSLDMSLKAV